MQIIRHDQLRWAEIVRPGDRVWWGQACGEPLTLCESLLAARASVGGRFGAFLVTCYSRLLSADHADTIDFTGLVGTAGVRPLSRAGLIDILPIQYPKLEGMITNGDVGCDVVLVQVSRPDAHGRMSPGANNDYLRAAIRKARIVVAEINAQTPWTECDSYITADDIDFAIEIDRPLVSIPRARIGDLERRIASHVVDLVPERAVVQPGLGATPDAILASLSGHRDLGIHAGSISDGVMDLMQGGAVTNAFKEIDAGVTVAGTLIGTPEFLAFANRNPQVQLRPPHYTHAIGTIGRLSRFISINSGLEVDLTGQVNAEAIGNDHVGTIGGQIDFVRGAAASPGGRSIMALPSTTPDGKSSRILARLSGPVTTPRSDIDVIVTEWGRAELAAKTIRQRIAAMIEIAHPAFREELARAASSFLRLP